MHPRLTPLVQPRPMAAALPPMQGRLTMPDGADATGTELLSYP